MKKPPLDIRWVIPLAAFCTGPAQAVTPLIFYTHNIVASSPGLKMFAAAMTYVNAPEGGDGVSLIVPTDSSCAMAGAEYPAILDSYEARRFVEERSVAGSLQIMGVANDKRWPLYVQLRLGESPWRFIKEGGTMVVTSVRGRAITVQIRDQQVIVGGYKVKMDFNGAAGDGWVLVVDGCGRLS